MDYPRLTISNMGEFLRTFKEFNEMPLLIHLCDKNHATAAMLKHLIFWGAGVGEMYYTAKDWEREVSLSRRKLETAIEHLKDLGLSVTVKAIDPQGMRMVSHYAIESEIFWEALAGCLADWRGIEREVINEVMLEMYNRECTKRTSANVQNEHPQMYTAYNSSLENLIKESNKESRISLPAGGEQEREREEYLLDAIGGKFKNYDRHRESLNEFIKRLGEVKVRAVIKDVEGTAVDWAYVINRLENPQYTSGKPTPNSAPPPPDEDGGLLSGKFANFFDR